MALRFPFGILLFYLLLLMCDRGNGARDVVAKQAMKHVELVMTDRDEVGRETKQYAKDQLDHISASGTRHDAGSGCGATYGTKLDVDDASYAAAYRTKQDAKDSPYIASYGTKLVSDYAATYRTKQDAKNSGYKAAYGTKLDSDYAATYRTKQDAKDSGYKAAYGTKLDVDDSSYAAAYQTKQDAKDLPYQAAYRTKLDLVYEAAYGTKQEAKDSGYKAAYGTKQEAKDSGYKAAYGTNLDVDDSSYKASYQIEEDAKDSSYETASGTKDDLKDSQTKQNEHWKREAKQNYMAAYGTKEVLKKSGMEHKEHCGQIDGVKGVAKKHDLKEAVVEIEKEKSQAYPNRKSYPVNMQDVKDSNYISAYGDRDQERKASVMVHENHDIPAKRSSSHMDHLEAFKSGLFTLDDLHLGKIMPLRFPIRDFPQFLPREEADSIPFSILRLPNVLQLFSVHPDSPTAKAMEDTLRQCEAPPIKGEIKLCPTSLESMLDFVHSVLGSWTNLDVLTTTHPTMSTVLTQNYTISRIAEQVYSRKWVVCHPFPYPYKVFYCHLMERSKLFKVSLGGENGHEVEAVAVCHMDTSDWDSDSILFRQLGVISGPSSPVCHFLPVYHLVWVPSPTAASASI